MQTKRGLSERSHTHANKTWPLRAFPHTDGQFRALLKQVNLSQSFLQPDFPQVDDGRRKNEIFL
jgi:hypothetical protein